MPSFSQDVVVDSQSQILWLQKGVQTAYHSHTPGHINCPACEQVRIGTMRHANDLQLTSFSEAFEVWLEIHKEEIRERTYRDYQFYGKNLKEFFGPMLLSQIHIGNVIEYRKQRQQPKELENGRKSKGVGAEVINHEIATLKQILKMAGLWDLIAKYYKPMRRPTWTPPKVLSEEQEERFFRVVAFAINAYHERHPDRYHPWAVAYWAASLSSNTSAIGSELRSIQIKHLLLDHNPPKLHVPDEKAKNEFRGRRIPLNTTALKQAKRLLERASRLGAKHPDDYLFPLKTRHGYNPKLPASAWFIRTAFRSMRKVLGPGFEWLTPRCFRNQLFTKLFEAGAPDQVIIDIGGHSAIRMSREYSRIRIEAKYEALKRIDPKSTGKGEEAENAG